MYKVKTLADDKIIPVTNIRRKHFKSGISFKTYDMEDCIVVKEYLTHYTAKTKTMEKKLSTKKDVLNYIKEVGISD